MENLYKPDEIKNSSHNNRLFLENGSGRFSTATTSHKEISNFRSALPQFLAVSVKNILLFVYGMTLGFPTIVIPAIQGVSNEATNDIVLSRDEISWFSSINLICVPLGCLFSGLLSQPIGKRRAMQFVNLPILASWLIFHFSTKTEHLYAALCLSGIGGGLMEAPVLTYVAEITEPKYRGILSALGSTCVISGVFIQFIMGSLMDWRTIAAVSSAFPVISIIALCFVPESPTWLMREQRFREAIKALQWLRGWVPEHMIEAEFNQLYDELITKPAMEEAEENSNDVVKPSKCMKQLRLFRKRSFLVPFLLVAYTFFTGHFSGKTTLQTYAVQIFHTLKAPINKYHATILLGVVEMVATIMCVFLIHFTGKRPLVLISTIGVSICFFGTATYAHFLKIIPGFAVNNVVVNASSIVPKESIISQVNITDIFASVEKNIQIAAMKDNMSMNELLNMTTPMGIEDMETTTMLNIFDNLNSTTIRNKRDISNFTHLSFGDSNLFDYFDGNSTNNSTLLSFEIFNSSENSAEDIFTKSPDITTMRSNIEDSEENQSAKDDDNLVEKVLSTNEVAHEILIPVPKQKKNKLVWLPLVLLLGSAFFAHFGIRMIPWILIGEVFPAPVRSTASGLVSGLGYIFGFLANKLFLQMLSVLTLPGTFWFYSIVAIVGSFVLYFTLPETEGRTLGEIEAHFSKKSDFNLLRKSAKKKGIGKNDHQIQSTQLPACPKVIQLQQSDLVPQNQSQGQRNLAFELQNTTHL